MTTDQGTQPQARPADPSLTPSSVQAAPAHRPRGAPLGNQNARKHGFYSQVLTPADQEEYERAAVIPDLLPEIALMRVKLLRLVSYPDIPPELLDRAVRTLTRLLNIQRLIAADNSAKRGG